MELAESTVERFARLCLRCPKMCRHVCTTHKVTRNDADTPNFRAYIAFEALQRGRFLPEEVPHMYEKCANCGLCEEWCETHIDVGAVMLAARADIVNQGLAPKAAIETNCHIEKEGNPYGEPRVERFSAIAEAIADLPDRAEMLYYIGCDTLYRQPEIALTAIKVLKAAKIDFTVLKQGELCCAEPQYLLGFRQAAYDIAHQNVAMIANSGARKIVFNCPSCLKTFKEDYPLWGIPLPEGLELIHLTELLEQIIEEGKLVLFKDLGKRVTYHDPCELGRKQGIYEIPRAVIASIPGLQFTELQRSRSKADCCGAGGALSATNLSLVVEASISVLQMAEDVSAEILLTACPTCKQSFSRHTLRNNGMETLDIVEVVALAAGLC